MRRLAVLAGHLRRRAEPAELQAVDVLFGRFQLVAVSMPRDPLTRGFLRHQEPKAPQTVLDLLAGGGGWFVSPDDVDQTVDGDVPIRIND
ncbi:hypothetical protein [Micromonospora sp. NPDC004551]|uniref:hypothetical protein n=1 Tax=Micromonospora sp. NPDC004551 TaxID=3154284 RepID=UPI0033BE3D11